MIKELSTRHMLIDAEDGLIQAFLFSDGAMISDQYIFPRLS